MTESVTDIHIKIREIECLTSKLIEGKKWSRENLVTGLAGKKEEKEKQIKSINRKQDSKEKSKCY